MEAEVSDTNKVSLGNVIYWSARPKVAVSDLLDWKISSCYAAEKVTVEDGKITASGKTYDLIKVIDH